MTAWRYRFAGLLFESALHLPEWEAFRIGRAEGEPDVRIVLDEDDGVRPIAAGSPTVGPDEYWSSVTGVGRYHVLGGRRIVVTRAPGAISGEVRLYLLGSTLAALCGQRGLLLLHASVVRVGARTVALCGPVGSGKSTIAAALIARGAAFVCDDLARFDAGGGGPAVYPSTPRFKLSPETVAALGWPSSGLERVHARARKFHVPQALADPWSPVPLHAICLLEWSDGPVRTSVLTGTAALRALVAAGTYRPAFLEPMGRLAAHWRQCAELAAGVTVCRLTRPREWSALEPTIAAAAETAMQLTHPARSPRI